MSHQVQFLCELQFIIISLDEFLAVGLNIDVLVLNAQAEAPISQGLICMNYDCKRVKNLCLSQCYKITGSTMNESWMFECI